jgi:hypothetical protein
MRPLLLATAAAAVALSALAACVAPGKGDSLGGRYVDPYTCEIKNKRADDPPYDPDCIRAAQQAAINAAKKATKTQSKK